MPDVLQSAKALLVRVSSGSLHTQFLPPLGTARGNREAGTSSARSAKLCQRWLCPTSEDISCHILWVGGESTCANERVKLKKASAEAARDTGRGARTGKIVLVY